MNWALGIKEPSLLVSLDTDLTTQAIRTAAILSGKKMKQIKASPVAWSRYVERHAQRVRAYDLNVNPRELLSLVRSETEYWGEPPALTVVDNVSNLLQDGNYEEYRKLFNELHRVARMGDTFILALHHVTRGAQSGKPLTMTSGQFAGEQEAEMMLGLWAKDQESINVSVLKNRQGEADPSGQLHKTLRFERERMLVRDYTDEELAYQFLRGVS